MACWAVSLAEKGRMLEVDMMKIPLVKPYRLSLKVGATKGDKKKSYYPIVYDEPVTFNVSVEGETLSIKEKTLSVPKHDKGAIVLYFVPMDAPKEETILVKLEEQSTGGEEEEEVLWTAYNKWHPAHGQDQRHVVLTLSRSAAAPRQLAPKFVDGVASDGSRRRMVRDPLENPRYLTHRSY